MGVYFEVMYPRSIQTNPPILVIQHCSTTSFGSLYFPENRTVLLFVSTSSIACLFTVQKNVVSSFSAAGGSAVCGSTSNPYLWGLADNQTTLELANIPEDVDEQQLRLENEKLIELVFYS